jgi:hypothetical protein
MPCLNGCGAFARASVNKRRFAALSKVMSQEDRFNHFTELVTEN